MAATSGYNETIDILIKGGIDPNTRNNSSLTVLMLASKNGNVPTIKTLLNNNANIHLKDKYIIRIKTNGSIPKDNPKFTGKDSWLPEIYTIGVRNPQGITISPYNNKIIFSNHGPRGGDHIGEAEAGAIHFYLHHQFLPSFDLHQI